MSESTSNLTRYFRNSRHFKVLEHLIVPNLVSRGRLRGNRTIRLWSAGCSTGEEPYSAAMLLSEILPPDFDYSVLAVDRSRPAVETAGRAVYGSAEAAWVPVRYLQRYFTRSAGGFTVAEAIRERVRFRIGKIEDAEESSEFDIVLCRNVLTYAKGAARSAILDRLWEAMGPYSYLVIGGSESLFGDRSRFEYLESEWTSFYRKRVSE